VTDLKSTLARLYALRPRRAQLGLSRVEAACAKLGNPERAFQVVHVGGTNGKGSVSAFVASMLRATGRRVGLYTSPHLNRFAERIQIDTAPIEDAELVSVLNRVMDTAPDLTFFEVATVAAFVAFRDAKVEIAVLEVGLGGRLDATNVVPPPLVAAITRVAFDHMADLGDSLAKIGEEKAGIIKAGSKVVLGKLHPDALQVIKKRMADVGATLVELGSPEPYPGAQLAYPRMAMFGTNLSVAATVARELGVPPEEMAQGIEATTWPGRNELLHRNGQELTLLDCAHNPDGAVTLSHVIDASLMGAVGSRRDVALVFGSLAKKNWRAMLARLDHTASHHVFTSPQVAEVAEAVDPAEMAAAVGGEVVPDLREALARARSIVGSRGLVIVTGSTFLVGPARALLLGLESDPAIDL
jgi:dihydrofolate synthase/folylpolyglutamate synthase